MAGRILVGTSSWADPGFVKEWYPRELRGQGAPALVRAALRGGRAQLELLRGARPQHRARLGRGHARAGSSSTSRPTGPLSRHAAALDSLPPDLRDGARRPTSAGGCARRRSSRPRWSRGCSRRPRRWPRRASSAPTCCSSRPPSRPARHALDELDGAGRVPSRSQRLAVELRHRGWVRTEAPRGDARLVRRARRGLRVRGRPARRPRSDHAPGPRRGHARAIAYLAPTGATPTAT